MSFYSSPLPNSTPPLACIHNEALQFFSTSRRTDGHLLQYEHDVRRAENALRREARNDLAREGRIATEGEIGRWRVAKDAKDLRAAAERQKGDAGVGEASTGSGG